MDDIRIIVEIVGHVAHRAKIMQPHIRKFGEARLIWVVRS